MGKKASKGVVRIKEEGKKLDVWRRGVGRGRGGRIFMACWCFLFIIIQWIVV